MSWEWRGGGSRGMSWCSLKSEKYRVVGVGREADMLMREAKVHPRSMGSWHLGEVRCHGMQCRSAHAGEEGFLRQQRQRTRAEDRTHVAKERFKQNQNAKAHTSVPAMDKVYSSPRHMKSIDANGSCKPSQRDCPQGRLYKCEKCQEYFSQKKTLIVHRRVHLGRSGRIFWCSYCGKTFTHPSELLQHQRMTHTGERPYKCSECDKSYRRKDYLLNHQRRHSGEGLFQCPLCRKRFVLRRSLMKHQETHMQETHLTLAGCCLGCVGAV
uniref:C2H2-type domain-containing protein n=1 Tax=Falco tinnunculus TaxID=100819 RepID=A0A8C4XRG0_FALTI